MINFLRKQKEIKRQINTFLEYKSKVSTLPTVMKHKEWLIKFEKTCDADDVSEITFEDVISFKNEVADSYNSEYFSRDALHSIKCFLKFYKRHDIFYKLAPMGRKPDLKILERIRNYRLENPPLSYRKIIQAFSDEGRKVDIKQIYRWIKSSEKLSTPH